MGVEEHYPEQRGECDDGHVTSVELSAVSGQVSVADARRDGRDGHESAVSEAAGSTGRSDAAAAFLNAEEPSGTELDVAVAAVHVGDTTTPSSGGGGGGGARTLFSSAMREVVEPPVRVTADEAVLRRAVAGDANAFREIFVRHRSDVARLVYRMLNGPGDLEDVVQEVFVQVFRSLKDFRGQSKFSTWLHRVTVNVVLMHRRSARSRPVLTEEAPSDVVTDERQPLPDEDAERCERMRAFQRLLARLAEKKRVVFVLHELEGLAPAEIAEIVGAPVLTVRTRLFYARRELTAMLGDEPSLENLRASFTKDDEGDKR